MKKKYVTVMLFVFLSLLLCSAFVPQKIDCRKKTEAFLAGIIGGQVDKSYDEFLADSLISSKPQSVQILKEQTPIALNMYGKPLSYEFIKQQKYGDSILRLVYITKSEQCPLTWEFFFYKASSDWNLINVRFSDQFDLLADK